MRKREPAQPLPLNYETPIKPTAAPFRIPTYRKILAGILISAGALATIGAAFDRNTYAKGDLEAVAYGGIIFGVVILFQHVKF